MLKFSLNLIYLSYQMCEILIENCKIFKRSSRKGLERERRRRGTYVEERQKKINWNETRHWYLILRLAKLVLRLAFNIRNSSQTSKHAISSYIHIYVFSRCGSNPQFSTPEPIKFSWSRLSTAVKSLNHQWIDQSQKPLFFKNSFITGNSCFPTQGNMFLNSFRFFSPPDFT